MKNLTLLISALLLLIVSGPLRAQETPPEPPSQNQLQAQEQKTPGQAVVESPFNSEEYASLLFTYWEHTAIDDARRSRGLVRAPTEDELMRDLKKREDNIERVKPPPEEREIRLGGIVYRSKGDWTIWLNEERVTPDAIPSEVLDLRVFNEYIEIKWLDDYTNQIFPIRLRANTRFNIDTRIFLPG